ncbi:DUF3099 domain-containing protein [Isoptericola jiangsuensis]|uniref:DUF3099 domain-containing protein n=1 Tax=Isoptericola jiangsuensis TaxID=548579 RepID=UPI003AABE385
MSTSDPQVHSISSVPANLAEDQWRRMRSYFWQMSTRVVLILVAALFAKGWLLWVCIAGAVVLPYTAVVFANAGRDRSERDTEAVLPRAPREIEAGQDVPTPSHRVVDHEEPGTPMPPARTDDPAASA